MDERYMEISTRLNDLKIFHDLLVNDISELNKKIDEYNELARLVRKNPNDLSTEERTQQLQAINKYKEIAVDFENAKISKEQKEKQLRETIDSIENNEVQLKTIEEKIKNFNSEILKQEEYDEYKKEKEEIDNQISLDEEKKGQLDSDLKSLNQQLNKLKEEFESKNYPGELDLNQVITMEEIEDRINYIENYNKLTDDINKTQEEVQQLSSNLVDLYSQQKNLDKIISKKEAEINKISANQANQIKEFENLCSSEKIVKGKDVDKLIYLRNTLLDSNLSQEEKDNIEKMFNDRLDKNNELLNSNVTIKDAKINPKDTPQIDTKNAVTSKGKVSTIEKMKQKFTKGIGTSIEFLKDPVAFVYNRVTAKKLQMMYEYQELYEDNQKLSNQYETAKKVADSLAKFNEKNKEKLELTKKKDEEEITYLKNVIEKVNEEKAASESKVQELEKQLAKSNKKYEEVKNVLDQIKNQALSTQLPTPIITEEDSQAMGM